MATFIIGTQGEITLTDDLLAHIGLPSGGQAKAELLPDRTVLLRVERHPSDADSGKPKDEDSSDFDNAQS